MLEVLCDTKWKEQLHLQDDGRCKCITQNDQQSHQRLQCLGVHNKHRGEIECHQFIFGVISSDENIPSGNGSNVYRVFVAVECVSVFSR